MFNFFKKEKKEEVKQTKSVFDNLDNFTPKQKQEIYENSFNVSIQKKPTVNDSGMDSSCEVAAYGTNFDYMINPLIYRWYATQAFIGFQTMAIIAQHPIISKCCTLPAKDAIRKGWKVTSLEDMDIDNKIFDEIKRLDIHKYNIRNKLVNQSQFTKIFGIRVALFEVLSTDKDYYEKPFNVDGVEKGAYKGIKQIDPYWCTPLTTGANVGNPASLEFYEPTYWMINGKKYHKSHLIITRGDEVADILKPTYQYAGISLVQKLYQRLYSSERIADEVPSLVMSKRMGIYKMPDVSEKLANYDEFYKNMQKWLTLRDNFEMRFIGAEDEIQQLETSLADLDVNIMTQFQLVCSIANIPSYKLLNAPMKGFSSGETEEASYREELENIQDYTLAPLLERHYHLMIKSDIEPKFNILFNPVVQFNELDSLTEKERAEINLIKAQEDAIYSTQTGILSQEDIQKKLINDETSQYFGMELVEPEEYDLSQYENESQDALDYIEKKDNLYYIYSESGTKLSKGFNTENEAKERLKEIEYFKSQDKCLDEMCEDTEDAEYQGKKVELNKPFRNSEGKSKFSVYVKNDKDNVVKVNFGDPNMEIKRDDTERRKAFRDRHNCEEKTDKTTAGYWSCKFWSSKSVSELLNK